MSAVAALLLFGFSYYDPYRPSDGIGKFECTIKMYNPPGDVSNEACLNYVTDTETEYDETWCTIQ